jgi:ankyrin repeat protein
MNLMQKVMAAFRPVATPAPATLNSLRDAIKADGDDAGALGVMLDSGPLQLDHGRERVFPVSSPGMSVVIVDEGTYPLILAAMLHKPKRLKRLLDKGASVGVRCGYGRTALHWAVTGQWDSSQIYLGSREPLDGALQAASLECTRLLLQAGAQADAADSLDYTALHRACMVPGKEAHVRLLIEHGAVVDAQSRPEQETALHLAARGGHNAAAAALVEAGASTTLADHRSRSALHWACALGNGDLVAMLLQRGADPQQPDGDGHHPLQLALQSGSIVAVRHVQKAIQAAGGASALPSRWPIPMLMGALQRGDQVAFLALLLVLDVNARDEEGVVWWHHVAMLADDASFTARLLDNGASLEAEGANGMRGVHAAAQAGKAATVQLLLARGAQLEVGLWRPLHVAAAHGHADVVKVLLERGANLCALADRFLSPLTLAVMRKHAEVTELLLDEIESTLGLRNLPGLSPLVVACERNDLPLVERLLRQGADPNAATEDGWTGLHKAIDHPGDKLLRALLRAGADPNAPSEAGYAPLHRAAAKGRVDLMHLLVEQGADPTRCDVGGSGLMQFARSAGDGQAQLAALSMLPHISSPSPQDIRQHIVSTLRYHIGRAPSVLASLEGQGTVIIEPIAGSNSEDKPFVVHWKGMGTAVAAIYRHLDLLFGPRILPPKDAPATPEQRWALLSASIVNHPSKHLHCMHILVPSQGEATVYYDLTRAAVPGSALLGLIAHSAIQVTV